MDPQSVLDTALAAGAANLGAPEAAKIFREQMKTSLRCNVNLTQGQKSVLRKFIDFPVIFTGGKIVTNDHPVLVACRDLTRDSFENEFKISMTTERTLIVGSSAREIRKYNHNPHIHYYVYGKENKDYDRIVRPALNDICKTLKAKANKNNYSVFLKPVGDIEENKSIRPAVKRYWKQQEILEDYMLTQKLPGTIHTDLIETNTVVLEDAFYNFGPEDYVDLFEKTGAEIAYGYGLLPMELIFPELPENPLYSVTIIERAGIEYAHLVFRAGYCNGYVHELGKWSTLLRSPVITSSKSNVSLAVEITARVGPMATFKIYRCRNPERIVRNLELSEKQRYVKVLDIMCCVDKSSGKVVNPLKYFTMLESEYLDVVNYLTSLDPKSISFQNTISYIRRRMGGMSLITKELVEPWFLPKRKVVAAALTIFLEVKLRMTERDKVFSSVGIGSVYEKFLAMIKTVGRTVFFPIAMLMDWILAGHLVDKLVVNGLGESFQFAFVEPKPGVKSEDLSVGLYLDNPYEGDIPSCPVCLELLGKLGEQVVDCKHVIDDEVTLKMTDDQIGDLRAKLMDTDGDPAGLAQVKKRCLEATPREGFSITTKVRYIKAGPGCGKSYVIRKLATTADLVMAPFTKLRPDYVDLQNEDGDKFDLLFKTTHRAMETRGCRRIFLDEFTSMPYEYLACVAYLNNAEEIYLVGDDRQTKVQEPDEGMYIGNHIQLDKLSTHELLVNFRNPQDTVALLNKVFGYKMRAHSQIERSIEYTTVDDLPSDVVGVRMAFSSVSAKLYTENEKNTVRANQGGTHKVAVLYCTLSDGRTPGVDELQIVGLSRHTEKLYIVMDGCDESIKLREKMALNQDFYNHMQTWLTFPNEGVKEVVVQDQIVDFIIKPVQPPKDMHLLVDTFIPTAAQDDVTTSFNLTSSALVADSFITGKFNSDMMLMPVNNRKHPINMTIEYYSICSGVGNHFSNKAPSQVLQVLQARYFNRQPFFTLGYKQRQLAIKIVNIWFENNVQKDFKRNLFDDAEVQAVVDEFLNKVLRQNYQSAFAAFNGETPEGRAIRFQLKGIFKPKHGVPDVYKAGQGISAWSTDACAMFCSVFRILTRLVSKTEAHHVLTDAYLPELDFISTATRLLAELPKIAQFATTDGIQFDANQNGFTQLIEMEYWLKYCIPQEFLDHYYSFRKDYKIISSVAIGFAGTQKTSGEPGTLVNNGVVSKLISNYVITGEGPQVTIYKGDDYTRRQLNLKWDEGRQAEVNSACNLGLRVEIAESTDFCGLTFVNGKLFPSIPRRLNKITAHRFRDYKHFTEYQIALRDWIEVVVRLNEMTTVVCNASHYKTTYPEMQDAFDTIKSISHIDRKQFDQTFKLNSETAVIPIRNSGFWDFVCQSGPSNRT